MKKLNKKELFKMIDFQFECLRNRADAIDFYNEASLKSITSDHSAL